MEAEGREAPLWQGWFLFICITSRGFPGGASVKELACQRWIPGSGRSPGVGNGSTIQDSSLENSMGKGAWLATVHGVVKTRQEWTAEHTHTHTHTHTRTPGGESGSPLQCSCLHSPMHRGAWCVTVHGAAKSQILLISTQACKLKQTYGRWVINTWKIITEDFRNHFLTFYIGYIVYYFSLTYLLSFIPRILSQ